MNLAALLFDVARRLPQQPAVSDDQQAWNYGELARRIAGVAGGYLVMQFAYSFVLKEIVLVDIFIIAIGFVMRAVSGAVVIGAEISPWLYIVTLLGALFLGLCKRRDPPPRDEQRRGQDT